MTRTLICVLGLCVLVASVPLHAAEDPGIALPSVPRTLLLAASQEPATIRYVSAEDPGIALPPVSRTLLLAASQEPATIRYVSAESSDKAASDKGDTPAATLALGPKTIQLGGLIGTALSWVMAAYMIYTVVVILIQLIWTCEEDEFELGAKRELKSCHDVGSYCKSKVLSACIERRTAYCCFNTPLARILNEQIRPQLGRGWGEADAPDCSGIAVSDFARVDWEQVNLDEWLAILAETGLYPTLEDLGLDTLTGSGSEYAVSGDRQDAAARSQTRSDGLDSDAARREAEMELWGSTLPALP